MCNLNSTNTVNALPEKWFSFLSELDVDPEFSEQVKDNPSLGSRIKLAVNAIYESLIKQDVLQINLSFGKDSSLVLMLFFIALAKAKSEGKQISHDHFIMHSDTGVENPEMSYICHLGIEKLTHFINKYDLPVSIVLAAPSLTSSWTGRILTGRGLPTTAASPCRQCSMDMKVNPATNARNKHLKSIGKKASEITMLLGSRDAEGAVRAASIARFGGSDIEATLTKGKESDGKTLYPIKSWSNYDVWNFLTLCSEKENDDLHPLPCFQENFYQLATLYSDAAEQCVLSSNDITARFGCAFCVVCKDSSMRSLLKKEKYKYMEMLNRIQRYMYNIQFDWSKRHIIGRTIQTDSNKQSNGYIKICPDVLSGTTVRKLLRAVLTADRIEEVRALKLALEIESGDAKKTEYNLRMSKPQFQIITKEKLLHIDFMWNFHHFSSKPFEAMAIWQEVYSKDIEESIHAMETLDEVNYIEQVKRTPQPKLMWLKVEKFSDGSGYDGLSDPMLSTLYFDGIDDPRSGTVIKVKNDFDTGRSEKLVAPINFDSSVTIDSEYIDFIFYGEWDLIQRKREYCTPSAAAQYYLGLGIISLAKGRGSKYDEMAQRAQCYQRFGLHGDTTLDDLLERSDIELLTNAEYKALPINIADSANENKYIEEETQIIEIEDINTEMEQLDFFGFDKELQSLVA